MNDRCCSATPAREPMISVEGGNSARVDRVHTLEDLMTLTHKFGVAMRADDLTGIVNLTAASGTLAAAVLAEDDDMDVSDALAEILIAALVVGAAQGVTVDMLKDSLQSQMNESLTHELNRAVVAAMSERGLMPV